MNPAWCPEGERCPVTKKGSRGDRGCDSITPACAGAGLAWLGSGGRQRCRHAAEPPNPSGSFGNGSVWLLRRFPPPSASGAAGSAGMSLALLHGSHGFWGLL